MELRDKKLSVERELDLAGEEFSIRAWDYMVAKRDAHGALKIAEAKLKRDKSLADLTQRISEFDKVMDEWYRLKPTDRVRVGIVVPSTGRYIR